MTWGRPGVRIPYRAPMIILGIETSCDETALALIETRGSGESFECRIINSLIHSQAKLHSQYGGVYPALAKREHGKTLVPLLEKLKSDLGSRGFTSEVKPRDLDWNDIKSQNPELFESFTKADFLKEIPAVDYIAVTEGPGLEPALWVGINFAKMLAETWQIPVIPVNHMEGHIVGSLLESDKPDGKWQKLKEINFPALALLISGGHTELIKINNIGDYQIIGQTRDDAVGEAYDKAARLLGLPYPGGPHLAKLAQQARDSNISIPISLPRPMIDSKDLNFSFSGLKTAILYAVRKAEQAGEFTDEFKKGLAREFEQAVVDTLVSKVHAALDDGNMNALIIGGGVSANKYLNQTLTKVALEYGIPIFTPSQHISGDNALMIALAGSLQIKTEMLGLIRASGTKKLGFDS